MKVHQSLKFENTTITVTLKLCLKSFVFKIFSVYTKTQVGVLTFVRFCLSRTCKQLYSDTR